MFPTTANKILLSSHRQKSLGLSVPNWYYLNFLDKAIRQNHMITLQKSLGMSK